MIRKILVPANEKTPVLQLMQKIARDMGRPAEFIVGFVETPELAGDRRIPIVTRLIDEIGRARTSDINCRLTRVKHDTVLGGVIKLAEHEHVDIVALQAPPSQPDLKSVDVWDALAEQSLRCCVHVFNLDEVPSTT